MCQHLNRVGDNYGESCRDCGKQLSGYGYGGWFGRNLIGREQCIHTWSPISDAEDICIYCDSIRNDGIDVLRDALIKANGKH